MRGGARRAPAASRSRVSSIAVILPRRCRSAPRPAARSCPRPPGVEVAVMLLSRRGPARSASRNAVACAMSAAVAWIAKSTCCRPAGGAAAAAAAVASDAASVASVAFGGRLRRRLGDRRGAAAASSVPVRATNATCSPAVTAVSETPDASAARATTSKTSSSWPVAGICARSAATAALICVEVLLLLARGCRPAPGRSRWCSRRSRSRASTPTAWKYSGSATRKTPRAMTPSETTRPMTVTSCLGISLPLLRQRRRRPE